jgi:hypothetical protein
MKHGSVSGMATIFGGFPLIGLITLRIPGGGADFAFGLIVTGALTTITSAIYEEREKVFFAIVLKSLNAIFFATLWGSGEHAVAEPWLMASATKIKAMIFFTSGPLSSPMHRRN